MRTQYCPLTVKHRKYLVTDKTSPDFFIIGWEWANFHSKLILSQRTTHSLTHSISTVSCHCFCKWHGTCRLHFSTDITVSCPVSCLSLKSCERPIVTGLLWLTDVFFHEGRGGIEEWKANCETKGRKCWKEQEGGHVRPYVEHATSVRTQRHSF